MAPNPNRQPSTDTVPDDPGLRLSAVDGTDFKDYCPHPTASQRTGRVKAGDHYELWTTCSRCGRTVSIKREEP